MLCFAAETAEAAGNTAGGPEGAALLVVNEPSKTL